MKLTRLVLVVALAVVVGGLALGSMARLGFLGAEASSSGLPAATSWMPASAKLVAYVDIASVLQSPLADELEASRQVPERLEQIERLENLTGVDPRTDLHGVSFSASRNLGSATGMAGAGPESWGLAVIGTFDPEAIVAKIEGLMKLERIEHLGETLFVFPPSETPGRLERHAMVFPKRGVGLFGTPRHVKAMLGAGSARGPSIADGELLAQWSDEIMQQETFWLVGTMDAVDELAAERTEGMPLPPLQTFALSGRVGSELTLTARGVTEDSESASKLADLARGLVAMGSMNQQSANPAILAILDSVQIQALENRVEVSLAIPFETLRTLSRGQEQFQR